MKGNLTKVREAAQGNANYFQRPYYIIMTTMGLRAERDAPADPTLLVEVVYPKQEKT